MSTFPNNDLSTASDEYLMNIVRQGNNFNPELVAKAKQLAMERKLVTPEEIINLPRQLQLERLAISQIHLQYSPELIKQNLSKTESNEDLVLKALNNAARSVVIKDGYKKDKDDGETSPWMILFAIFVIVRLVITLVRIAGN